MRPYLDLVDQAVGAIGWRLHGNMIHLAHGNPAILFSNCSRGESFCETFGLPRVPSPDHVELPDAKIAEMVDRLLDPATFAELPQDLRRAPPDDGAVPRSERAGAQPGRRGRAALSAAVI